MKLNRITSALALAGLYASSVLTPLHGANVYIPASPDSTGVTPRNLSGTGAGHGFPELFLGLSGGLEAADLQAQTMPGFFVSRDGSTPAFPYGSTLNQGGTLGDDDDCAPGFMAHALNSSASRFALGLHEGTGHSDMRLYLRLKNDTGNDVDRLLLTYTVEQWRDGKRYNKLGLKYKDSLGDFDTASEILSTLAPVNGVSSNGNANAVDGTLSGSQVNVTAFVPLPSTLANNGEGYLRWAFGTESGTGVRDSLGVTNVSVIAIGASVNTRNWSGSGGDNNWTTASNWSSAWVADANANFAAGTGSTVTLDGSQSATDLIFGKNFTIAHSSGTLSVKGVINVASGITGTINAPVAGTYGIIKINPGTLVLGAANPHSASGVNILAGTVKQGVANAIDDEDKVAIGSGATFDLNGYSASVESIEGADGSTVAIGNSGSHTLTLNNVGNASIKGAITGTSTAAKIIKKGAGTQRFRSSTKNYSAITQVDEGSLEITNNSGLPNTADIILNGVTGLDEDPDTHGDLLLTNDDSGTPKTFTFGSSLTIDMYGGSISGDGAGDITLANNIYLDDEDTTPSTPREAHNNLKADGPGDITFTGVLSGPGGFRKTGSGVAFLSGSSANTHAYTEIRNGTLVANKTGALAGADLYFQDKANERVLEVQVNATVTYLDGNSPDPEDPADDLLPQEATAFIDIPSTKTFTVDYDGEVDGLGEEIKPSFQGDIRGVSSTYGTFVKDGTGTQRFTIWPKTFAGSYVVNQGVLQVSHNGRITGAAGITVEQGGQLRLSTGVDDIVDIADATYNLGGTLTLKSTQRATDGTITYPSGSFGVLGGLRFDPDTGIQYGRLASAVAVTAASDIHINGVDKVFYLSGSLTGSAALSRTGGGTLVFDGNTSGYTGTFTLTNGTTTLAIGTNFGGSIVVNADELQFAGGASIGGSLDVNGGTVKLTLPGVAPVSALVSVGGSADLGAGVEVDLGGTGAAGLYPVFQATGAASVDGSVTVTGLPSGLSADIFEDTGIIYVELY